MAVYPATVRTVADGENANAAETNKAVVDLTARTDWLKAAHKLLRQA
jgi:hypothetical protein